MVINDSRVKAMPTVPTTKESGANAAIFVARTFFAPKGTSPEKIAFLEAAFKKVAENPEFQAAISAQGVDARFIDRNTTKGLITQWYGELKPRFEKL
jgi:tripartite-type tricarboxylate transporter receptor subunit TctC